VAQSDPALAILLPGRACGIPYAPEYLFLEYGFHPDSFCHNFTRASKSFSVQPYCNTKSWA